MRAEAPSSFAELYAEHFAFVWRTLRALGVSAGSLDDAVQDVFVVVHRQLPQFEGRSSLRTWMFSICARVAANYRRRERRRGTTDEIDPALASPGPGPGEELERAQAWSFVARFLDELDDGKRAVFVLSLLEGMSAPEVADMLGIRTNTVYTRLHAARRAFREAIEASQESFR